MKFNKCFPIFLMTIAFASAPVFAEVSVPAKAPIESQWKSKKVVFLGDSITDKRHVGTTKNYWQYLEEMLGIKACVYGINGHQFSSIPAQAAKAKSEMGSAFDAVIIFAGTNDYIGSVKLGEWYTIADAETEVSGPSTAVRKRRTVSLDPKTFRGRINLAMSYLKENFPDKQVILLTPIHRGFAKFSPKNIQPDETFPNRIGLYIDDYVNVVKEAANVWAVPVIDLNSICGLYPNKASNEKFFHDPKTDLLHPSAKGHYKMAKSLAYMLLAYPANFE